MNPEIQLAVRKAAPAYNGAMSSPPKPEITRNDTASPATSRPAIKAQAKDLNFYYGGTVQALKQINLELAEKKVTALIGPSGCGKSTFLRCFNRMHDLYPGNRYEGEILIPPVDVNILARNVDPIEVRMRISMVFQKPNPFPKTIYENVAYGLRRRGGRTEGEEGERADGDDRGGLADGARHADDHAREDARG